LLKDVFGWRMTVVECFHDFVAGAQDLCFRQKNRERFRIDLFRFADLRECFVELVLLLVALGIATVLFNDIRLTGAQLLALVLAVDGGKVNKAGARKGRPSTYVSFRNGVFLALAISLAEGTVQKPFLDSKKSHLLGKLGR